MFFDQNLSFKIKTVDLERIDQIIKNDGMEKYGNLSHFCRVAVLKLIREEEK